MDKIIHLEKVSEYNLIKKTETLHPLVSVIDNSNRLPIPNGRYNFGFYAIFLKETKCGELVYGRNKYDYEEGTLIFIGAGQVVGVNHEADYKPHKGLTLIFHPDLIRGTSLGQNISKYHFFSYELNEALHISQRERELVTDLFGKIQYELSHSIDKHSRKLITHNIELLLGYCERFYDRQFITREQINQSAIEQFEMELNAYYKSDKPVSKGLPSVSYFADKLHLSANYFGDLVKKETGKSAKDYVHLKIMNLAKEKILDESKSVSEIAYELGFKYPQHFTRMFKNSMGVSPTEYRSMN
ncbi:helix-turn-helix domain-containing protein [Draconibacterium orientale]|uniref:helix-turn-helix domain-containing protein n=1 Tax=Draconibacterium orientale TaxID=1168034 RepID=UPI002A0A541E|nr:helix-turn-helix domain-containing protein [Draconibacterium orientale]